MDPNCADLIRSEEVRIGYDPIRRIGGSDSGFEIVIRPLIAQATHTHSLYTIADTVPTAVSLPVPPPSSLQGSSKFAVLLSASSFKSSSPRRPQQIFKVRICLVAASSLHRRRFISARLSWRLVLESRLSSRRSSRLGFQSRRPSRIGFQPFFILQGKGCGSPFFSPVPVRLNQEKECLLKNKDQADTQIAALAKSLEAMQKDLKRQGKYGSSF
ncbi:hypothetical protein PIB30_003761 [Stylosanthes scabra]|uniref:Uncharacterized protein n=1 Tax=Stylosanthes scabra TaxID=79078 RepID=A0ABU6R4M2_9FABA|nr:hypothetical protein [Stylosanthes scabra]